MIKTMLQGVSMALADSVPGVSGGTIAFILGFYERFMGAIHGLIGKNCEVRKSSFIYLFKFAIGWAISMAACIMLLSKFFESHIYFLSSLFLGFTVAAIPFIAYEERGSIRGKYQYILFTVLGIMLVVLIAILRTGDMGIGIIDFRDMNIQQYGYMFFSGAIAVSAMLLPGISGSTILLILGVYMPTINAIKEVMNLNIYYMPGVIAMGLGILFGIFFASSSGMYHFRSQMVYMIIGLLIGSLYAIIMGPATLDVPKDAMSFSSFNIFAFLSGIIVLAVLEYVKLRGERIIKSKEIVDLEEE